jgi:S1-C subfamily serine protease
VAPARVIAVVALVAAVLGGAAAALIVSATGWGGSDTTTVVVGPAANEPRGEQPALASVPPLEGVFDPARIYANRSAGVVTIIAFFDVVEAGQHASQGSGFVVSRRGHVLTNAHVITNAPSASVAAAETVYVEFADGDRVPATVVGWDLFSDVGVLEVDPDDHPLKPVPLGNSEAVSVGSPVVAIGSPFGRENTLTTGVVSATKRSIESLTSDYDVPNAIQTDAAINRGNSGGPLFDAAGRVIGINAQIRSESGANEGVGFAVPVNTAKRVLREILARGEVRYAYAGVSTQDLTPSLARQLGYAVGYGAVVACVEEGSPAARAGLRGGHDEQQFFGEEIVDDADVVIAVNGRPVRSGSDLVGIISQNLRPGRVASFRVVRGKDRLRIPVKLGERPEHPAGGRCR